MPLSRTQRPSLRRIVAGTTLILAASLTITACTSSGSDDGGSTASSTAGRSTPAATDGSPGTQGTASAASTEGTADAGATDGFTVLGAIGEIPAGSVGEQVWISAADLDAVTAAAGLTRPTDPTGVAEWLHPLSVGNGKDGDPVPAYVVPPEMFFNLSDPAGFEEAIGWTIADVGTYVTSDAPPRRFTVVSGEFDDSTLPSTLTDLGDGVFSYGDGEDLEMNPAGDRTIDQLGRATRLAQQESRIAVSTTTPEIKVWLGGPSSGADSISGIASVATALDSDAVISAVIASSSGNPIGAILGEKASEASVEELNKKLAENSISEPFDVIGIGWTADSGVRLVYHFPGGDADATAARDSVEHVLTQGISLRKGDPVAETLGVEGVSVEADGDTVIAVLPSADGLPGMLLREMLMSGDVPFVYWNADTAGSTVTGSATRSSAGG